MPGKRACQHAKSEIDYELLCKSLTAISLSKLPKVGYVCEVDRDCPDQESLLYKTVVHCT